MTAIRRARAVLTSVARDLGLIAPENISSRYWSAPPIARRTP